MTTTPELIGSGLLAVSTPPTGTTVIGHADGQPIKMDLDRLIKSRLLVQAMSGAGKSYMLRLLAERFVPQVQTIIIDAEGEFFTLRDKLDMLMIGEGGEMMPTVDYASRLGNWLLQLGTSAIIDLSSMDRDDRRWFVRFFCGALLNAPKVLWHPMLLLLDEAHDMCPERGMGKAESTQAVIDLAEKGRKRGFCTVLATQRLSKLHKNAAAECTTVLIGRTSPVDLRRAADLLGMPQRDRRGLAYMADGEWVGIGPAIGALHAIRFQGCVAETDHLQPGRPPTRTDTDHPRVAWAAKALTQIEKPGNEWVPDRLLKDRPGVHRLVTDAEPAPIVPRGTPPTSTTNWASQRDWFKIKT